MGDMHAFYETLKAVYRPTHQIEAPLRSSNGSTLLTHKVLFIQRYCHAIQYCSVFHAPKLFFFFLSELKARRKHDTEFRARSKQVESTPLTNLRSDEKSRQTERVKHKWRTFRCNCLLLSFAFIACIPNSVRRKQGGTSHPRCRSLNLSSHRSSIYLSRSSKIEATAF